LVRNSRAVLLRKTGEEKTPSPSVLRSLEERKTP
jgi:hypothetical protein